MAEIQRPERTVAIKMGVKADSRAHLVNVPPESLTAMRLPRLQLDDELRGSFAYLHLFTTSIKVLDELFPTLKEHLADGGMLWVSWPKARQLNTDLTLPEVVRIGYGHGLVESTCLSIDTVWSGLKFTHPKPGKTYRNSHGRLPNLR